jgi:hypothetical protein
MRVANDVDGFLKEWHRVVAERDLDGLAAVLAPEVSMGAPPYWARMEGHALVHHLLGLIVNTIEEFTYHREWVQGNELALEFTGRVGDLDVQGIDLITLDDVLAVAKLDVLIRPLNALEVLRDIVKPQMMAFLSAG